MKEVVVGVIVDETLTISRDEFCGRGHLTVDDLQALVETGIVAPVAGKDFPAAALSRARRAQRLKQGLDLEWETVAIVLDLIQEIESLKQHIDTLRARLGP